MCSPARALLPRFESKHERSVPRGETAAKGRCSLPFTSCFGAQQQDQTPSQPLALSPASSRAPRAEGLTVTGSATKAAQQAQDHTLRTRRGLLCQPWGTKKQHKSKMKQNAGMYASNANAAALFSSLAPAREPPSRSSSHVAPETSGATTAHGAPALFLGALACC